jgi:hypothetical protein
MICPASIPAPFFAALQMGTVACHYAGRRRVCCAGRGPCEIEAIGEVGGD